MLLLTDLSPPPPVQTCWVALGSPSFGCRDRDTKHCLRLNTVKWLGKNSRNRKLRNVVCFLIPNAVSTRWHLVSENVFGRNSVQSQKCLVGGGESPRFLVLDEIFPTTSRLEGCPGCRSSAKDTTRASHNWHRGLPVFFFIISCLESTRSCISAPPPFERCLA